MIINTQSNNFMSVAFVTAKCAKEENAKSAKWKTKNLCDLREKLSVLRGKMVLV